MKKRLNIFTIIVLFLILVSVFNCNRSFAAAKVVQDGGGREISELEKYRPNVLSADDSELVIKSFFLSQGRALNIGIGYDMSQLGCIGDALIVPFRRRLDYRLESDIISQPAENFHFCRVRFFGGRDEIAGVDEHVRQREGKSGKFRPRHGM